MEEKNNRIIIKGDFAYPVFSKVLMCIIMLILFIAPLLINGVYDLSRILPELLIISFFLLLICLYILIMILIRKRIKETDTIKNFIQAQLMGKELS